MSVYDRAYMNEDEPGGGGKSAISVLIVINIIVWLVWGFTGKNHYESAAANFMYENFMVTVDGVLHHYRIHTLLTSAISHQEPMHLLMNMLFFWFLCDEVERVYGKLNFFVLYAFCAITGSLAYLAFSAYAVHAGLPDVPALGASGAIMGIAVVAAIFDPRRPIYVFGLVQVPLKWLVIFYFASDLYSTLSQIRTIGESFTFESGGVAYCAHLGGALGGFLFWRLDLPAFRTRGRLSVGWFERLRRWIKRPRSARLQEVPRELPREPVAQRHGAARASAGSARRASGRSQVDAKTSQRVDELLSKISREGMNSLTDEERRFLQESSQKYKR